MGVEVVKVQKAGGIGPHIPPDIGTNVDAAWKAVKRRPAYALAAIPFAVGGVPATIAAGAVALTGVAVNELAVRANNRRYGAILAEEANVQLISQFQASGMTDIRGKTLQSGVSYFRHPVSSRRESLVPAKLFHKIMLEEQLAEIVEYIRSQLNATSIVIKAESSKTGAFVAGGAIHSVSLGAKLGFNKNQNYALKFETRTPIRVEPRRPLVWINDFPVLQASLAQARDGNCVIQDTADLEYDLSVKAAESLGIDGRWVSKFSLTIDVEFA